MSCRQLPGGFPAGATDAVCYFQLSFTIIVVPPTRKFGRSHARADIGWLVGPMGGPLIGDAPYREVAAREDLEARMT